jgi:hypothetical protein
MKKGFAPLAWTGRSIGHAAPVWFSMPQQLGMASLDKGGQGFSPPRGTGWQG